MEVVLILGIPLGICTALAYLEAPRRRQQRSGRTYDPQRPVIRRAGAVHVGLTGRMCSRCGIATFGWSERCGKCHLPTSS